MTFKLYTALTYAFFFFLFFVFCSLFLCIHFRCRSSCHRTWPRWRWFAFCTWACWLACGRVRPAASHRLNRGELRWLYTNIAHTPRVRVNNNGGVEKKTEFVEFWWPGIGIGILSLRALGSFVCAFVCLHDTQWDNHTHARWVSCSTCPMRHDECPFITLRHSTECRTLWALLINF